MKMSQLCLSERPREKAASHGTGTLSDAELLAVLLRTGTREMSAVELSQTIMNAAGGSLVKLSQFGLEGLSTFPGVKLSKAVTLLAALELGRRLMAENCTEKKAPVRGADAVYRWMLPKMKGLRHEECWVLFLDKAQCITGDMRMSIGGDDSTVIDVRCIIREALSRHAGALILAHNHPSGNPLPGEADVRETLNLKKAAEAVAIPLMDHVIICDDCYYSFCDECVGRP